MPEKKNKMNEKTAFTTENPLIVENTDLALLQNRPLRISGGAIIFCLSGEATVSIDLQKHKIYTNSEIILIPDSTLMLIEANESFRVIFFSFSRQLFNEAHHRLDAPFIHYLKHHPIYRHSSETASFSRKIFSIILSTYTDNENRFRTTIIANFLRNILLFIYNNVQHDFLQNSATVYNRKEELYHRFIGLVIENCIKHRDVEFYTNALCISKSYLASVTKNTTGETPKSTIDKHIIQEIKILLAFSDMQLQQIADHLHFPDQSYLGRYFKHHTGQSLFAYRSQITNK